MPFNDGLYNMYREVDELSLLNKLFTTLLSEEMNIKNYLANTIYSTKLNLEELLNDAYYVIDASIDDVKDLIKIKKGFPIYKLDDIELISIIKTKVAGEYKDTIVIENMKKEIEQILHLIKDIINKTEISKNYETITTLSNISFQIKKILLKL